MVLITESAPSGGDIVDPDVVKMNKVVEIHPDPSKPPKISIGPLPPHLLAEIDQLAAQREADAAEQRQAKLDEAGPKHLNDNPDSDIMRFARRVGRRMSRDNKGN